jgi:hypothetical protein
MNEQEREMDLALAECEAENRLLRARNERLMKEVDLLTEALRGPAQEAIFGMNQDDWKDVVAAITKVRDGRGIYLACRPRDVFQEWFLALGTAKIKEKNT